MIRLAIACCVLGACISAPPRPDGATRTWRQRPSANGPGGLLGPRLAYDSAHSRVVMYGGVDDSDAANGKTYALSGDSGDWTEICAANAPKLYLPAFGVDPFNGNLLLAGGSPNADLSTVNSTVYECSGSSWSVVGSGLKHRRAGADMVADVERGQLLVMGGVDETGTAVSAVEISLGNAATWGDFGTIDFPVGGRGTAVAYDRDGHRVLALASEVPVRLEVAKAHDELWELPSASQTWNHVCDDCSGIPRGDASLVHAAGSNETYLINGFGPGTELAGTWVLETNAWVHMSSDVPARDGGGAAFDESRNTVVAYGGNGPSCVGNCDDTWELVAH